METALRTRTIEALERALEIVPMPPNWKHLCSYDKDCQTFRAELKDLLTEMKATADA